jgi:hypothetical protein
MPEPRRPSGLFIAELMEASFGVGWNQPETRWVGPQLLDPAYRRQLQRELAAARPMPHAFVTDALEPQAAQRLSADLARGGGRALESLLGWLRTPAALAWHAAVVGLLPREGTLVVGPPPEPGGWVFAWLLPPQGAGVAVELTPATGAKVVVPALHNALLLYDGTGVDARWLTQAVVTLRVDLAG